MRPVFFIADCHLANHKWKGGEAIAGINDRARRVIYVLQQAVTKAVAANAAALVVLGDLFDNDRPSPQIMAEAQSVFQAAQDGGVLVILLDGNHDQTSDAAGHHALAPLAPVARVVDTPELIQLPGLDLLAVPFQRGNASEFLPGIVKDFAAKRRNVPSVLALHMGIFSGDMPKFLHTPSAVPVELLRGLADANSLDVVISGDYHGRRRWGNIVQCGALAPTGFSNPGLTGYGSLWKYDGSLSVEELDGPRFVQIVGLEGLSDARLHNKNVYIRAQVSRTEVNEARAILEALPCAAFEIEINTAESLAIAKKAATAAKSSTSLSEAVDRYVRSLSLGDLESEVLEKTRLYLNIA